MIKNIVNKLSEKLYSHNWVGSFNRAEKQRDYRTQRKLTLGVIARYCPEDKKKKLIEDPLMRPFIIEEIKDKFVDYFKKLDSN